ncbi:MAG TPA: hypothetical protein H9668_05575 [Firmicutes bacterium]|nr:hypothetical protein [Bacillota bacterium]
MAHAKKNQALLLFVRRQEYRRRLEDKERWGHVGGRIYTIAKIFYIIGFLYSLVINLAYMLGRWLLLQDSAQGLAEINDADYRSALYLVLGMTILQIAGLVLVFARKSLPALICTALSSVLLLVHYYQALAGQDEFANNGISNYLFRHVLPLIILLVAAVILFVIHVRERRAENAAYDRLTREIYKKHAKEEGVMGQEEWEELLNKYAEGSGLKGARKEDA